MILASDFGLSWILELVALVLVAYVVWKYVWVGGIGLRGMINTRQEAITAELNAGEMARQQGIELVAERRRALESARTEATQIREQARAAAAQIVADGERRATEDYERFVLRAGAEVDASLGRVQAAVSAAAGELILRSVQAIIEAELDGASHHRLIAEAIGATEAEEV